MAKKTVVGPFYNEEWLLPFWLKHHREIFDHGIMIDYHSTDRSVEIIKELCPTWEIHTTRNGDFNPGAVDAEVIDYERPLEGWRTTLNTTEFLFGNYDRLNDDQNQHQFFCSQYMFIDMERREEPYFLDSDRPLYHQRWWGYGPVTDFSRNQPYGSVPRAARSIHNFALPNYGDLGRHYPRQNSTHPDLCIFYYGYASLEEGSIKRKMQIQGKCPNNGEGTNHKFNLDQLMDRFKKEQQPMSRDMRPDIKIFIDAHEAWLAKKKFVDTQTHEHIRNAIAALNTALGQQ
jgi:hypothetical protein